MGLILAPVVQNLRYIPVGDYFHGRSMEPWGGLPTRDVHSTRDGDRPATILLSLHVALLYGDTLRIPFNPARGPMQPPRATHTLHPAPQSASFASGLRLRFLVAGQSVTRKETRGWQLG